MRSLVSMVEFLSRPSDPSSLAPGAHGAPARPHPPLPLARPERGGAAARSSAGGIYRGGHAPVLKRPSSASREHVVERPLAQLD